MATSTTPLAGNVDHLYKLIGTEFSFFTVKARAYLQWKNVPYCEVLATADVYKKVIRPYTGEAIIPVLVLPGADEKPKTIQDSKDIMDHIHARFPNPPLRAPDTLPEVLFMDMLAELVADEWLSLSTMQHRWGSDDVRPYYEFEFGSTMGEGVSPEQRLKNGAKASKRFATLLPPLGVTPQTIPVLDAQFDAFVESLNNHLTTNDFVLGLPYPTLADFALYGPLYSGSFRDPVRGPILKLRASYVSEWVERLGMRLHARAPTRAILASADGGVRFVRPRMDTEVNAERLLTSAEAWLRVLLADFLPQLLTTVRSFRAAASSSDTSKPFPRAIGSHEFTLRWPSGSSDPVVAQRATTLHVVWMVQRIVEKVYEQHAGQCDTWLAEAFGQETAHCWKEVVEELRGIRVERVGASVHVLRGGQTARL